MIRYFITNSSKSSNRAKLVILGIWVLTLFVLPLRETLVTKFVILDISFLISSILALRVVLVAKLVISGI